jgi:hypothetical protein
VKRALPVALLVAALVLPAAAQPAPACGGRSVAAGLEPARLAAALERTRSQIPNAEGTLWRVERAGVAPSHLFGTMHSTDGRLSPLPAPVREALASARVVAVEVADLIRPGPATQRLATAMVEAALAAEDTIAYLPPERRAELEAALAARGLPPQIGARLRPWMLNVLIASPMCEMGRAASGLPTVDAAVADGRPPGARLVSLETAEEQIATLRALPAEVARHALEWSVRHLRRHEDVYATLVDLYLQERPVALVDVAVAAGLADENDRTMQLRFLDALGGERDRRMAERALPLLAEGGAFVAVGALHLPGRGGLVERFRAAGYQVTRVR